MRFLAVTETCDLASLYLRLIAAGHELRVSIEEPLAQGTLAGMAPRSENWRDDLDWVRDVGPDGVVLFEAVSEGFGALQDGLRRDGYNVIGGSVFGDRLENDRGFAFDLLRDAGLQTALSREFDSAGEAEAFLDANPGRYVLKFSGPGYASGDNYIGQLADGRDIRAMLRAKLGSFDGSARFVLMEYVDGVEIGVGAYFDGEQFLGPACLDWEHKRFFADDLGELTGEMGTVATFDRSAFLFERTLAPIAPQLREAGHVGYVNLNTIVNEAGIWPLEFTCRFGYPGYSVLEPLQEIGWDELFRRMVHRRGGTFQTSPGFSVGIVISTPPFPYSRKEIDEAVGLPISFREPWSDQDLKHLHYGEVGLGDGELVTSGLYGWTMVVTGTGVTIADAQAQAYARSRNLAIPNMRYRLDIGEKLRQRDFARVEALGLFG